MAVPRVSGGASVVGLEGADGSGSAGSSQPNSSRQKTSPDGPLVTVATLLETPVSDRGALEERLAKLKRVDRSLQTS